MRSSLTGMRLTPGVLGLYAVTSVLAVFTTSELRLVDRVITAILVTGLALVIGFALRPMARGVGRVLIAAVCIGTVRGVALIAILEVFAADSSWDLLRVVSSAVSAVIWIGVIAFIAAGREDYRVRFAAAVRDVAEARAVAAIDALPEVRHLKSAAESASQRTSHEPSQEALRAAAQTLRAELEASIRPLSHRIWFSPRSPEPHARIAPLVRDAALGFTVPVWPVVVVWTVSTLIGAPVIYGIVQGTLSALLCAGFLVSALLIATRVMRRVHHGALGPVLLVLVSLLPALMTEWVLTLSGFTAPSVSVLATYVLVPLALGFLLLAASAVNLANADRETILAIAQARQRPQDAAPTRDVSAYLHNSLQSELAGLALQLDRAAPGTAEAQAAVERLAALASRSIADDFRAQRESPLERIQTGAAAWRGIAEVVITVDGAVDRADPRLHLVVQAVEELTSNAVRHGGARTLDIALRQVGDCLELTMTSDGDATALLDAGHGMGLLWLAEVSVDPVTVQPTAEGVVARVLL